MDLVGDIGFVKWDWKRHCQWVQEFGSNVFIYLRTSKTFAYLYQTLTLIHHEFQHKVFAHMTDTKDVEWTLNSQASGGKRSPVNTTSRRQAVQRDDNERDCPCTGRDDVDTDSFTSLWNKFRDWRMVQGDLCSWIISSANFPFLLLCVVLYSHSAGSS